MRDNCDPILHSNKRALSRFEKQWLPTTAGRALLLPSHPPKHNQVGEVEELIAAGYEPLSIVGVERDPEIADSLYRHYLDTCQIHLDEVADFCVKTTSRNYTYIHLDFCSQFNVEVIDALIASRNCFAGGRLRITVCISRCGPPQRTFERKIQDHIVAPLYRAIDRNPSAVFNASQMLAICIFLSYMYDVNILEYLGSHKNVADIFHDVDFLSDVTAFYPTNLQQFEYNDNKSITIATLWVDLVPMLEASVPNANYLLKQLELYLLQVEKPAQYFNPHIHSYT